MAHQKHEKDAQIHQVTIHWF